MFPSGRPLLPSGREIPPSKGETLPSKGRKRASPGETLRSKGGCRAMTWESAAFRGELRNRERESALQPCAYNPPRAVRLYSPLRRRLALHGDHAGPRTAARAAPGRPGVAVHPVPSAGDARLGARGRLVEPGPAGRAPDQGDDPSPEGAALTGRYICTAKLLISLAGAELGQLKDSCCG